jgi:LDH2 family malate/lactate/ureidoglycolate dehydrogenase
VNISIQELTQLSKKAISKYGYSEEEAKTILDMLMYAQMRGNDQGIVKLIGKGIPRNEKAQTPTIEKETPTTAIINANLSMEAIAMEQAVNMVIRKAKEMGIAIVILWCYWLLVTKDCGRRFSWYYYVKLPFRDGAS